MLTENVKRSELHGIFDNIEIINFNYDRCIERYLPTSISEYYGIPRPEIERMMQRLRVHRPYGMCGRLPWMQGQAPSLRFGQNNTENLGAAASQIRTFTEQIQDGDEIDAIRNAVSSADRIIFLGFAFHRQNVRLLSAPIQSHTRILATAYRISNSDQSVIKKELAHALGFSGHIEEHNRVELSDLTCSDLFRQYWRTITADSEPF